MLERIGTIFLVLINILRYWLARVFYLGRLKGPVLIYTRFFPSIRIRNNGLVVFSCGVKFRGGCNIFSDGGVVKIGEDVFFNNGCSLNAMSMIEIGAGALLGEGVKIYDHDHAFSLERGVDVAKFKVDKVNIGAGCWLGSNVIVTSGVVVSDRVAVGAGSVVVKNITEPGVYVAKTNIPVKIG